MLKLIRSTVGTAVAAWAWKNRSQVISTVKSLMGDKNDAVNDSAKTGYAETVDSDGLMTPEQAKRAANA